MGMMAQQDIVNKSAATWLNVVDSPLDHEAAILLDHEEPQIFVLTGPTATVAEVIMQGRVYSGSCKLHPNDKNDPAIGTWLAISRALESAAKAYKKAAWSRVNATR